MPLTLRWKARIVRQFAPFLLGAGLPVFRLSGLARCSGRRATILVAGHQPWIDYLPRRFFAEPPDRELICKPPLRQLPHLLSHMRTSADLTIARVDRISIRLFFQQDYLRAPEWIGTSLRLDEESLALAYSRKSVRHDRRKIRRHGMSWSVSHADEDFTFFYETMYAPYARHRFGEMAGVVPASYLCHEFRRGGVLFIEQNGEKIAASLFSIYGDSHYFMKVGTRNGERWPVEIGALAALYLFGIDHARSLGCKRIDFGASRSFLQDGTLRFKLKWNPGIVENSSHSFQYLIYWNGLIGAAADFFLQNSVIFYDRGRFSAIQALDDDPGTALKLPGTLRINGLQTLYLISPSGVAPDIHPSPGVVFLSAATQPGQFQSAKGFTAS